MFHRSSLVSLMLLPLAIGCAPSVQVEVLQPALVTFPADIQTIAIIDRSKPAGAGEAVLGTLEGLVTGEMPLADREGASAAVQQAYETLTRSPRFEVVNPGLTKEQVDSSIWADNIDWDRAKKICKKADCDAIVALEAFDSDSTIAVEVRQEDSTDSDGKPITVTVNTATRTSTVMSAWRVYDVKHKRVIDEVRDRQYSQTWDSEGGTRAIAIAGLPDDYASLRAIGQTAGDDYARRIAPNYIWVSRSYYGKGHDRLKTAKNHVKASDWDGAGKIWEQMVQNQDDAKVRGKAEYNLALYYERQGDLESAIDVAKKAAIDLHNGRSRRYVAVLSQRLADQQLLQEQMRVEEEKKEAEKSESSSTTKTVTLKQGGESSTSSGGSSRSEQREKK
jgi:tetratricopeptide (TPR) repeat protein